MNDSEKNQESKALAAELRAQAAALAAQAREIEQERLRGQESGINLFMHARPGQMRPVQSNRKPYNFHEAHGTQPLEPVKILRGAEFVPPKPQGGETRISQNGIEVIRTPEGKLIINHQTTDNEKENQQ